LRSQTLAFTEEAPSERARCPWHGWKFNLEDGSFSVIPTLRVKTYKVEQNGDGVFIEV